MARQTPSKPRTLFETRVKAFRVEAGLTHQDVAMELKVSASAVDSWERAGKIPGGDTLVELARLYGRKAEDFFQPPSLLAPGVMFLGAADLPPDLREQAIKFLRDINRRYRERGHRPSGPRTPVR